MGLIKKFFSVTKEGIVTKARKGAEKACKVMLDNAVRLVSYREKEGGPSYKQHFHSGLIQGRPHWSMDFMGVLYYKGIETECGWWEGYHSELLKMDDEEFSEKVDSSKLQSDERTISELLELKKEEFLESELASETVPILTEVMTFEFEKWWNEDKPWFEYALAEIGNVAMEQAPIALRKFWQSYQD